ncbi:MAG: ribosomal-processing cysteine protease Prp [Lachnospiraceae bacterium]|nr:ribosomal-processing cysteine protease Prp [Lachnospiraceae bacterium]
MIKVDVIKENGIYKEIHVNGHAGFSEYGTDVVCSAVSMLVINTVNAIEHFTEDAFKLEADEKKGNIDLIFTEEVSHDANLLIDTMLLGIKETEKEYGNDYVSFTLKEV